MVPWQSDNIFLGTAWYYARFRPDYPEQVIKILLDRFSLGRKSRVLDLGCGTGQISFQLAPFVSEVIAVDPQEDMLKEGKSIARTRSIVNIRWILGESAQLNRLAGDIREVDLTVIARAFHWMDREQTLGDLYHITRTRGGLAIIWDNGPRDDPTSVPWKSVIDRTVKFWLGDTRLAGTGGTFTYPTRRFEDTLLESQYRNVESAKIETKRTWTIDRIIGYLYSTSSSSIPVLGDRKERFDTDVRRRLQAINTDGIFEEEVTTSILMAWKV
jgi:ubiquinone/menaquinone biosynthesis C-methylase UbiE